MVDIQSKSMISNLIIGGVDEAEDGMDELTYCKRILKVKLSTSSAGVYGELGRYPLYIARFTRIIRYWFKLINTENCVLKTVYIMSLNSCLAGKRNWAQDIIIYPWSGLRMGRPTFSESQYYY